MISDTTIIYAANVIAASLILHGLLQIVFRK